MMSTIQLWDWSEARKRRLAKQGPRREYRHPVEGRDGSEERSLLRLAAFLGVFFFAWLFRGLGVL